MKTIQTDCTFTSTFSLNPFVDVAHKSFYISYNSTYIYIYDDDEKKKVCRVGASSTDSCMIYLPIIILFPC